jgi:predicted nucleic acid-binding protein
VPAVNFVTASQQADESTGSLSITFSISQSPSEDVTANLILTGTALNGSDYTLSQNYITFPAYSSSNQSVTLIITDDDEPEDFESVIITIDTLITQDPAAVIGNNDQISLTINNSDGFDETPPVIFSHELINDSTLVITYSEKVDPVTSQTVANYSVDNGVGNPSAAVLGYFGDSTKVELSFPVFSAGLNYTMTINNVNDLKNNVIAANTTFSFAISTGSEGWVEYFENKGTENGTYDGSYFTGTRNYDTGEWDLLSVYIEPASAAFEGDYAVRLNDSPDNSNIITPAVNGVDSVIFYYRALNGDDPLSEFSLQKSVNGSAFTNLTSQTFSGSVYTQFAYEVNDPSDNIRLKIVNDGSAAHLIIDNFKVVTFSGPAQDTTPPEVLSHVISGSDIILTFSEILDPITSQEVTNYVLDNGGGNPSAAVLGYIGDSSKVVVSYPSFLENISYTLTINYVEDKSGNPLASNTTVQFLISSGGSGGDGWVERFEDGPTWTSYATGTKSYGTGDWDLLSVYLETSSFYSFEGTHAVRLNDSPDNSSLTSPIVNGVDSVIFYYRALNGDDPLSEFSLQKSVNGSVFTNITSQTFSGSVYTKFAYEVNDPSDNIRLKIVNNGSAAHLIIDYFKIVTFPVSLNAPSNVLTEIDGTDLTLTWSSVTGALSYDVYSSNLPYDGFAFETSVTSPEFTTSCTDSKKFYYIVASTTAKSLKGGESHERFIEIKNKLK